VLKVPGTGGGKEVDRVLCRAYKPGSRREGRGGEASVFPVFFDK